LMTSVLVYLQCLFLSSFKFILIVFLPFKYFFKKFQLDSRCAQMERQLKQKQPMARLLAITVFIRKEVKPAPTA
jgi:hypothetical protein